MSVCVIRKKYCFVLLSFISLLAVAAFFYCNVFVKDITIKHLSLDEMKEVLKSENVVLIDNRPKELFDEGHIPNAINMPYALPGDAENIMTEETLAPYKGKTLVFYCSKGVRAGYASESAKEWKISNDIEIFTEGFGVWKNSDLPVVK